MGKKRNHGNENLKQHNNDNQLKGLNKFVPNRKQRYVNDLLTKYPLVFVQGFAGTGKTSGILHHYCEQYLQDKSKRIIVIRTPVEAGADRIGALPGGEDDKLGPHFTAAAEELKKFIGTKFEADKDRRIFFKIPNYAIGATWHDSLVLIDEAQQIQPAILKLLLERLGENTVCAVVGDPTQLYTSDKNKRNGLSHAMNKFFVQCDLHGCIRYKPKSNMVASFAYEAKDNVRSEISREVVRVYSE